MLSFLDRWLDRLEDVVLILAGKKKKLKVVKIYKVEVDDSQIRETIESALKLEEVIDRMLEKTERMSKNFKNIAHDSAIVSEEFNDNEAVKDAADKARHYNFKNTK